MNHIRLVCAMVVSVFIFACSGGELPTYQDIKTLSCSEVGSGLITCNNGNTYLGPVNVTGSGGAGGLGDSDAGIGGEAGGEQTPAKQMFFMCFAPPQYPALGQPCVTATDCPPSSSTCEFTECVDGKCDLGWVPDGTKACPDPNLWCVGSYCCGLIPDPN